MKQFVIFRLFFFILILTNSLSGFAPTNFYRPYDINWRLPDCKDKKFRLGVNFEYGDTNKCRDSGENRTGVLRLYNQTESSLGMLLGAEQGSDIYNLANLLLPAYSPATDDGVRGRFEIDGKYTQASINFEGRYKLPIETIPGNFELYLHVPFKYMQVSNVVWRDLTKDVLNADLDVHQYLTDDIFNNVSSLGDGLDLTGFKHIDISDIVCQLWWYQDYKQLKEHLKNVRLNFRLGVSAPTGNLRDEDKSLDFEIGNDGSWGFPFAAAIDLDFIHHMKAGLEFEMLFLLDNTRERRLKTHENQTDFLLLHKGVATISPGMTWKFNLYLQKRFAKRFTTKIAYQFVKHDSDKLTAESNKFDYYIINTAERLQEWNSQNFIFQFNFDFFTEKQKYKIKPQLSVFAKLPITGKRVINTYTFGGQLAFNF
ncbi:hypothetical protein GF385_00300 [Candidatus Dependentiae bacterium]|nr:hypothetical protein [Candidatus Dependentiae bacterium]